MLKSPSLVTVKGYSHNLSKRSLSTLESSEDFLSKFISRREAIFFINLSYYTNYKRN